jgi:hypothetical protein
MFRCVLVPAAAPHIMSGPPGASIPKAESSLATKLRTLTPLKGGHQHGETPRVCPQGRLPLFVTSLGSLRGRKAGPLAPREEPRRAIPSRVTRIRHKPPTPHLRRVPSIYSVSPLPALLTGSLHAPWPRADTGPLREKNMQQQFFPTADLSSSNNPSSFSPSVRQGPSPALRRDLGITNKKHGN